MLAERIKYPLTEAKFVPLENKKAYQWSVYFHSFLTLVVGGFGWSNSHLGHFGLGKKTPVPIEEKAEWAPEPLWTLGRREKYLSFNEIRIWCLPCCSLISLLKNALIFKKKDKLQHKTASNSQSAYDATNIIPQDIIFVEFVES
jgi:hypothetical protein